MYVFTQSAEVQFVKTDCTNIHRRALLSLCGEKLKLM